MIALPAQPRREKPDCQLWEKHQLRPKSSPFLICSARLSLYLFIVPRTFIISPVRWCDRTTRSHSSAIRLSEIIWLVFSRNFLRTDGWSENEDIMLMVSNIFFSILLEILSHPPRWIPPGIVCRFSPSVRKQFFGSMKKDGRRRRLRRCGRLYQPTWHNNLPSRQLDLPWRG